MTAFAPATLAVIAIGGAAGALARHGVNTWSAAAFGLGFPWGTVIVNILGSFLMGVIAGAAAHGLPMFPYARTLIATGFLGAFTTFSTFSLDAVSLWQRGETTAAALYVLGSVVAGAFALLAGLASVRMIAG